VAVVVPLGKRLTGLEHDRSREGTGDQVLHELATGRRDLVEGPVALSVRTDPDPLHGPCRGLTLRMTPQNRTRRNFDEVR
jgi:hypothetical protein